MTRQRSHNPEQRRIVAELCRQFPKAGSRTLARRLNDEHPTLFPTIERARAGVRYHRGNKGRKSKVYADRRGTARPNRQAGELPPLPESLARPLNPYLLDTRRLLILADIHVPYHDNQAIEAALAYGEKFKPDTVLINGDGIDFEAISRFQKDPRGPTTKQELQMYGGLLAHISARFPRTKKKKRIGNHEERWEHMLWLRPDLLDLTEFLWEKWACIAENDFEVIRGRRPIMAGQLPIWHGHEKGKQLSAPVNQARGMFLKYLCSALESHGHRQSEHTERTADDHHYSCWSTGCLCGLWPEYAKVNKWSHGFATVVVAKDGSYGVELKRIIDGKVY